MTIIGSLHDLRCTPEQCVCDPIVIVCDGFNAENAWGPCNKCGELLADHEVAS